MGDAIMAFWGAPVADPEHARHAVLTALAMQKELKKLAEPFRKKGWPELHIGVGVNTGMMTVGDMGSPVRKAYTVMGDAVNLGSRLESITKQYGVGIIVGPQTRERLSGFVFREIDRVRVKGSGDAQDFFLGFSVPRNHLLDARFAFGDRAGLVHRERFQFSNFLKEHAAFDEDAAPRHCGQSRNN